MKLTVVTPNGVAYDETIEQVTIPTTTGQITVLSHHIPLVSVLQAGELVIRRDGTDTPLAVSRGILEVRPNNEIFILADTAERAEQIDIERANRAKKRAEELLQQKQFADNVAFARIQAKIEKEVARLHVGRKYRKIRSFLPSRSSEDTLEE